MNILLCGASGFVGRHIEAALIADGQTVIRGIRKPTRPSDIAVNFSKDTQSADWLPRLTSIDVVINTVGVLRDLPAQPMQAIHTDSPTALFRACEMSGVRTVIHLSALGVDQGATTRYRITKRLAEEALQQSTLNWTILRPSVIYGPDGASAKMFRAVARAPIIPLPAGGHMRLQPVHIDDISAAVTRIVRQQLAHKEIITCVGPNNVTYQAMLASYAQQLGCPKKIWLPIPKRIMEYTATLAGWFPTSPLEPETLQMLFDDNIGDPRRFSEILGRAPRALGEFISPK